MLNESLDEIRITYMKKNYKVIQIKIAPLNSIDKAIEDGYLPAGTYFSDENVPLDLLKEEKLVHIIVPNGGMVGGSDIVRYMSSMNLKACTNAPNYLLGLVKILSEQKISELEGDAAFISIGSEYFSYLGRHVMHVDYENGKAGLYATEYKGPDWHTSFINKWYFLAESIS